MSKEGWKKRILKPDELALRSDIFGTPPAEEEAQNILAPTDFVEVVEENINANISRYVVLNQTEEHRTLSQKTITQEEQSLNPKSKYKKYEVIAFIKDKEEVELNSLSKLIMNGIASHIDSNYKNIARESVIQIPLATLVKEAFFYSEDRDKNVSDDKQTVLDELALLSSIRINVQARNGDKSLLVNTSLLEFDYVEERQKNGVKETVYLKNIPILYFLARENKNLRNLPKELFHTPKGKRNSKDRLCLMIALAEKVTAMINNQQTVNGKKYAKHELKFDTILEYSKIEIGDRKRKSRLINHIRAILNYWQELGFLTYKEDLNGKKITFTGFNSQFNSLANPSTVQT